MGFRWIGGKWKWFIVHGWILIIKLWVVRHMVGVVLREVMSDVRISGAAE